MSTLISAEKVARSWFLTKIKAPPPAPKNVEGLSADQQEDLIENAYDEIKHNLIRSMKSEFGALDRAERRIAKRHGIDPLFLNWYVVNGSHWPSMSQRVKKALKTIQDMRLWFGQVPSSWSRMKVPSRDEAKARDSALKELGDWFLKNIAHKIETSFISDIWKKSRDLLNVLKGRGKGSSSQASILLLKEFKQRLQGDRFQLKPAVRRMVSLFD